MKKHIPNIITCCNLICGCIAVGAAFQNPIPVNYFWAIVFILLGAIFDFFDGNFRFCLFRGTNQRSYTQNQAGSGAKRQRNYFCRKFLLHNFTPNPPPVLQQRRQTPSKRPFAQGKLPIILVLCTCSLCFSVFYFYIFKGSPYNF